MENNNKYGENREMNGNQSEPKNQGMNNTSNKKVGEESCTKGSCADKEANSGKNQCNTQPKSQGHATSTPVNSDHKGESCTTNQKGTDDKCCK